jgi:hypothetical protein
MNQELFGRDAHRLIVAPSTRAAPPKSTTISPSFDSDGSSERLGGRANRGKVMLTREPDNRAMSFT